MTQIKIGRVTAKLDQTLLQLQKSDEKYQTIIAALANGETQLPGIYLEALVVMSPGDRNIAFESGSLGGEVVFRAGLVGVCSRLLRDNGKLSEACKLALTKFLVEEGSK